MEHMEKLFSLVAHSQGHSSGSKSDCGRAADRLGYFEGLSLGRGGQTAEQYGSHRQPE